MNYDPERAPKPDLWLELDEGERIVAVEDYHVAAGVELPSQIAHAAFHVAVENQLAQELKPVVDTMIRLRGEGLTRHDALHAIGSVLAEHMQALLQKGPSAPDPNEAYYAALRDLSAERWRRDA